MSNPLLEDLEWRGSSSVSNSITALAKEISDADAVISNQRKRFSGMISQ